MDKEKKIFSLAVMQTTDAVTVFVKCPQVREPDSYDINRWIELFEEIQSAAEEEMVSTGYEHCLGFLKMVKEKLPDAELWSAYNVPCCTGNEMMFVVKVKNKGDRDIIISELEDLETKYGGDK